MKGMVAFVVATATLATTGLVGAQVGVRPSLDVLENRPLVVRGRGFKADEHVVVLLHSVGRRWARAADATSAGSFTARFPVARPRCRGFKLQAFGSRGSRALYLSRLHLDCEPLLPDTDPDATR